MEGRLIKAEVIEVIHVLITRGDGSKNNVVRNVDQYWSLAGDFLAEKDPLNDQ
ncbi:hypothetical protein PQ689_03120 [Thermoanaerobacterium thermosaccharolyticum]|uniref:hypothetical protein n=1 Tax=Thermoanaerobacterium thermosaccharolyticum TaxID=1517 RepID=UPI003DA8431C